MRRPAAKFALRLSQLALSIGLAGTPVLALAEVARPTLEKAEALMKAGKADEAYLLLEPLEVDGAGDVMYDYLLATSALESKRPSKATFVYERILAVSPGYIGVRADMGRAYFALGDYGRAKIEFETVLTAQNLPPDLRSAAEQYVKAAEARSQSKRTVGSGYLELGYGRDNNIGSATDLASINLPAFGLYTPTPPTGQKTGDNYATVGLGGEVTHQFDEQWSAYVGADYRGRGYKTFHDTGYWTLDGRTGLSYSGGAWQLRGGVNAGEYFLNHAHLRNTVGATLDWRLALNPTNQISLGAAFTDGRYVPAAQTSQDTQTTTLTAGWLTALGDGSAVLGLNASGGREASIKSRDDGDKLFYGARFFLQKNFTPQWGAYISSGVTLSKYNGLNTYYTLRREERLLDAALGLTWAVVKGVSVRPQLQYVKNTSNAELYAYDKTDISVNVRMDF